MKKLIAIVGCMLMIVTTADYKTSISANTREDRIVGTIRLVDNTVVDITEADMVRDSLYIDEQIVPGEDIAIGSAVASELGFKLIIGDTPYNLKGAKIDFDYHLVIAEGSGTVYSTLSYIYFDFDEPLIPSIVPLNFVPTQVYEVTFTSGALEGNTYNITGASTVSWNSKSYFTVPTLTSGEPDIGDTFEVKAWEIVPLGVYTINQAKRSLNYIDIKAYDNLLKYADSLYYAIEDNTLVTDLYANISESYPEGDMATTLPEIESYPNYNNAIKYSARYNGIEQLINATEAMVTFGRMNRYDKLEISPLYKSTTDREIKLEERITTNVSDKETGITRLITNMGNQSYYVGAEGITLELQSNIYLKNPDTIESDMLAMLTEIEKIKYNPFDVEFIGDPSLQPGDWVLLKDTKHPTVDVRVLITHSTWRFRGKHLLRGVGGAVNRVVSYGPNESLGALAGLDMVQKARLGDTIIDGGFITTDLLNADNIQTGKLLSFDGKTYFDLDTATIKLASTIGGKAVTVTISPSKPFELSIGGKKQIYISSAGVLVESIYDINEDGFVNGEDVQIMIDAILQTYRTRAQSLVMYPKLDVDGDGLIDSLDLALLIKALPAPEIKMGSVTLNSSTWVYKSFGDSFANKDTTPTVVLTANTSNTGVITAKVRNITELGFEAIIGGTAPDSNFNYIAMVY